ncbi:MAG: hypothetical protein IPM21_14140 [Acidobacteria bacterium]|nr:hypothetical protein [Acidobacteriota bacterium]
MRYRALIFSFLLSASVVCFGGVVPVSAGIIANFEARQDPVYTAYRGVKIGMSTAEARGVLGDPKEKFDTEDIFQPADGEEARVLYDEGGKVHAISVMYTGDISKAPAPKVVVGENVPAREDGGMFKRVEYEKLGFWISYAKVAGDNPMIIITMQAI